MRKLWECDGILFVVRRWPPTLPETGAFTAAESLFFLLKSVAKPNDPPLPTEPLVTRSALSLIVASLVQPAGAVDCWNSMRVPRAKPAAAILGPIRPSRPRSRPATLVAVSRVTSLFAAAMA